MVVEKSYEEILHVMAPCGLHCGKCMAFAGGHIQREASILRQHLGPHFDQYAERFATMNPVFKDYPAFKRVLDFFAEGSCQGCRKSGCLFKECKLAACVKEHGVDYCFQCKEFPCDRHGLPSGLAAVWRRNNQLMKEHGVEDFYEETKNKPRYP